MPIKSKDCKAGLKDKIQPYATYRRWSVGRDRKKNIDGEIDPCKYQQKKADWGI